LSGDIKADSIRVDALSATHRALWVAWRAASPRYYSPFFDLRFVETAARICPHAGVTVLRRGDAVAGFLPFQRRGGVIQPLGAPLSDYHGVLCAPDDTLSPADVVRALGADRIRFNGLVSLHAPPGVTVRSAMISDLSGGYEAYLERRRAQGGGGFFKDKRRRRSMLEREHGPVTFEFSAGQPEALDLIVAMKRDQLRRTGNHDIFACGWTVRLLEALAQGGHADFGLRIATLRAGGRVIAAEAGLLSGNVHHLWFPVYDPAFARYSPGALMTLETLKACAAASIATVDFCSAGEDYKFAFAAPGQTVYEGSAYASGGAAISQSRMFELDPRLSGIQRRMLAAERRLDCIIACETDLPARTLALSKLAGAIARRHPRLTLAAGISLGLGLGAGLMAD
jgi:CelD/BcsL family acetyltransferase involved in cellulose biosynthesis